MSSNHKDEYTMTNHTVYIGIDVSKAELEISLSGKSQKPVPNSRKGIGLLLTQTQKMKGSVMLCCEATGGYEKLLIAMALARDIPVALLNPKRVRDFARSKGILAKTDKIDAAVIASFAQQNNPAPLKQSPDWLPELQGLVARRETLMTMRKSESNRMDPEPDPAVKKSIRRILSGLKREILLIERQIQELVQIHDALQEASERLQKVSSIGPITAHTLMATVPELGSLSDKQVTALVGLAPFNQDSGCLRGKRTIKGGRAQARKALYMAAVVATRHNPILKDFYCNLKQRGKPSKVALTAVMRKLLILANRIMANKEFSPAG
jgi:transposase